jgi:hypothetical protein
MRRAFFTPSRLLAAAVALLLILSLCPPGIAAAVSGPPQHVLDWILGWGTLPLHRLSSALRGQPPQTVAEAQNQLRYLDAMRENKRLWAEVQRLQTELRQAHVAVFDPSVTQHFADVAGTTTRAGYSTLSIYHDLGDALTPGAVVVSPFGEGLGSCLVGRISEVSGRTATVELITARGMRLNVAIGPATAGNEHLRGERPQLLPQAGGKFTCLVKASTSIAVGDLAYLADTTSGWRREAQGLIVGKVVRVEPERRDPMGFRTVTVEPIYDLTALTQVTVLIPGAAGTPPAGTR